MLEDERRNNFALRVSIENIESLLDMLESCKTPSPESIVNYKKDLSRIVDSITNYHERFKDVLETVNHIKELNLPTSFDETD